MNVLITGVSGFIGEQLAARLAEEHAVIGLSRSGGGRGYTFVQGSFDRQEELSRLDEWSIDAVVHLAAVTGGCGEEEGLTVNVLGTRRLYRYLLDRGCRKFVTASSIAAIGCLDPAFLPERLPIPDDHRCLATDAYGFSKAMVEEMTHYFHRQFPDADFVNLRLASVVRDDEWNPPAEFDAAELTLPFVQLARIMASDAVEAIARVAESPLTPRVLNVNLAGPDIAAAGNTAAVLRTVLGERAGRLDLSGYELPGRSRMPLYDIGRLASVFGFAPRKATGPRR